MTTTGNAHIVGNGTGDAWPQTWPYYVQYPAYYQSAPTPVECSGDVHVFPCPHCDKCKCGKARKEQP